MDSSLEPPALVVGRFRWVTGAAPQEMVDGRGRRLSTQFTVKEHGEYKGIKQTSVGDRPTVLVSR